MSNSCKAIDGMDPDTLRTAPKHHGRSLETLGNSARQVDFSGQITIGGETLNFFDIELIPIDP